MLATGASFTGIAYWQQARRQVPGLAHWLRAYSLQLPLPELVRQLNAFAPAVLAGYPTALAGLAAEQRAGRLHLHPALLSTGAEWAPRDRAALRAAFGCPLRDTYSASEFMHLAFECAHSWLHVNADWLILEAVDAQYTPVAAGVHSHTTLLTNLANRVQPILRYDLGDRIVVRPTLCRCGRALPAIRVERRRDEILRLRAPDGATRSLSALALTTLLDPLPGVAQYQVIQTGPAGLSIRLAAAPGADRRAVWEHMGQRLRAYLAAQGLANVAVDLAAARPQPDPVSGKLRRVWAARPAAGPGA